MRAITADGAFRILTAITTDTVRSAARAQGVQGSAARQLGELITGAILVRECMSPDRRVQLLLKSRAGRTHMVADSHPSGWNRGIVQPGATPDAAPSPDGHAALLLEVLYTMQNNTLRQSVVELSSGHDISASLMTYMQESEQIVSMIAVGASVDDGDEICAAGGYMVQLLPDAPHDAVSRMTERLAGFDALDAHLGAADASADGLRTALCGDIATRPLATTYLCFGCNCDRDRVLTGLGTLPDDEITQMIHEARSLDICCDACGKQYRVSVDDLRAIMAGRQGAAGGSDLPQS